MFNIKRKTKIKYRRLMEKYLIQKYEEKLNYSKNVHLSYRRAQLKLF